MKRQREVFGNGEDSGKRPKPSGSSSGLPGLPSSSSYKGAGSEHDPLAFFHQKKDPLAATAVADAARREAAARSSAAKKWADSDDEGDEGGETGEGNSGAAKGNRSGAVEEDSDEGENHGYDEVRGKGNLDQLRMKQRFREKASEARLRSQGITLDGQDYEDDEEDDDDVEEEGEGEHGDNDGKDVARREGRRGGDHLGDPDDDQEEGIAGEGDDDSGNLFKQTMSQKLRELKSKAAPIGSRDSGRNTTSKKKGEMMDEVDVDDDPDNDDVEVFGVASSRSKKASRQVDRSDFEERQEKMKKLFDKQDDEQLESLSMKGTTWDAESGAYTERTKGEKDDFVPDAWLDSLEVKATAPKKKSSSTEAGELGEEGMEGEDHGLDRLETREEKMRLMAAKAAERFSILEAAAEKVDELRMKSMILQHMLPGETLKQALNRLSAIKNMNKQQLKKKNVRTQPSSSAPALSVETKKVKKWNVEEEENVTSASAASYTPEAADKAFTVLTDAAMSLSTTGNFMIYAETFEDIRDAVEVMRAKREQQMLAQRQSFEQQKAAAAAALAAKVDTSSVQSAASSFSGSMEYYYKWKAEDAQVHGPFTKVQMTEWSAQGYFASGIVVMKEVDEETGHSSGWTTVTATSF